MSSLTCRLNPLCQDFGTKTEIWTHRAVCGPTGITQENVAPAAALLLRSRAHCSGGGWKSGLVPPGKNDREWGRDAAHRRAPGGRTGQPGEHYKPGKSSFFQPASLSSITHSKDTEKTLLIPLEGTFLFKHLKKCSSAESLWKNMFTVLF